MAYALAPDEPLPEGIRRVMGEQLDRIETHLQAGEVHDARKRLKEIRALLRLIRTPLGMTFTTENAWYRDIAHELSAARDAEAVLEAIKRLMAATDDPITRDGLRKARRRLARRRKTIVNTEALLSRLGYARARLADWPGLEDDFDATLAEGLQRTLRAGRNALARASENRAPQDFHELRKRVKDHWYHTQLLTPAWPHVMKGHGRGVERLSDLLGEQHDLVIAAAAIGDDSLQPFIAQERRRLEDDALRVASLLFSESPRSWCKRVRGYWRGRR
jgi:CHAD domain-containing protein